MEQLEMDSRTIEANDGSYPGYPIERFVVDIPASTEIESLPLPDGPWTHNNTALPTPDQSESFKQAGYTVDTLGRPLHPWARTLLSSEQGGAIFGKGFYRHWGPNYTADPIIITNEVRPRILLIKRADTQVFALPGGFVDGDETGHDAAVRETKEETGLEITVTGQPIYEGPVDDPRATLHAWPETSAYLFRVDDPAPVEGMDDAQSANWHYIDELPDELFGAHASLIDMALDTIKAAPSVGDILALPEHLRDITEINAGHMAYHHYKVSYENTQLFVKEHDPAQFSDPHREMHSRAYLVKEHLFYRYLSDAGFTAIPQKVERIDDTLLSMEHLDSARGWVWKVPKEQLDAYIHDVFSAFDHLQAIPTPIETSYHQTIAPTYETFWKEGWDAIDDALEQTIYDKITSLSSEWKSEQRADALRLIDALPTLKETAQQLTRNPSLFLAHNDARQSNIAWHAEFGAKLVDWSWADVAPKHADSTMLLIDLAKSGHDVSPYLDRFNADFAHQLIGFWLAHSTWQTKDGNQAVREHQIASAANALKLILRGYEN